MSTWEDDWHLYYHGEALLTYAKAIATRYGKFANVIAFLHGGDDDAIPLHAEVKRCVPLYRENAPHVLNTFHAGIGPSYPFFGNEEWYDFCMNYTYDYDNCIHQMLEAREKYPHKPAVLGETHYDGNDGITPDIIYGGLGGRGGAGVRKGGYLDGKHVLAGCAVECGGSAYDDFAGDI